MEFEDTLGQGVSSLLVKTDKARAGTRYHEHQILQYPEMGAFGYFDRYYTGFYPVSRELHLNISPRRTIRHIPGLRVK
jgi:hypothetical protein